MKQFTIEVDDIIMNYLKEHAKPFIDTPNSVLHRLLFKSPQTPAISQTFRPSFSGNTPKALSQVLEVISEVIKEGRARTEATRIVAERNHTKPQTIIDKYCRQLGKKAYEVDRLLDEPGMGGFKAILMNKFPTHSEKINKFFNRSKKVIQLLQRARWGKENQHENLYG